MKRLGPPQSPKEVNVDPSFEVERRDKTASPKVLVGGQQQFPTFIEILVSLKALSENVPATCMLAQIASRYLWSCGPHLAALPWGTRGF